MYDALSNRIHHIKPRLYDVLYGISGSQCIPNKIIEDNIYLKKLKDSCIYVSEIPFRYNNSCIDDYMTTKLDIQTLTLYITDKCNLRCKYCIYSGAHKNQRTHSGRYMTFKTACRAVDYYISNSDRGKPLSISFYGGEPLLEFQTIMKVVEYVRQRKRDRKLNLYCTTNGVLLKGEIVDFFIKNNIYTTISLDGPQAIHDIYRRDIEGKGTHKIIVENIEAIKCKSKEYYHKNIVYNVVMTGATDVDELHDYFSSELFANLPVRLVPVHLPEAEIDVNEYQGKGFHELRMKYLRLMSLEKNHSNIMDTLFSATTKRVRNRKVGYTTLVDFNICVPGRHKLITYPDGKFSICERVNDKVIIGNIDEGIKRNKVYHLMSKYALLLSKHCFKCWAAKLCQICYQHCYISCDLDEDTFLSACDDEKGRILSSLIEYTDQQSYESQAGG